MNQEIKDKTNLNITISDILSVREKNKKFKEANEKRKLEYDDAFKKVKSEYDPLLGNKDVPYAIKQKYNLEYVFLFERYNKQVMPLENNAKKRDLYDKRLSYVLKYINAKYVDSKSVSQTKALEYAINNAITAEAIAYYDTAIEEARQDRIVSSKFKFYVDYLQKTKDPDYEKRVDLLPSQEEIDLAEEKIERLQHEKAILIDILRSEKFTMEDLNLHDLINENIKSILFLMYPTFKEKILDTDEKKGKQVA